MDQAVAEVKASLRRFAVELLVASVSATESVGLNSTDLGTLCLLRLNGANSGRTNRRTDRRDDRRYDRHRRPPRCGRFRPAGRGRR